MKKNKNELLVLNAMLAELKHPMDMFKDKKIKLNTPEKLKTMTCSGDPVLAFLE